MNNIKILKKDWFRLNHNSRETLFQSLDKTKYLKDFYENQETYQQDYEKLIDLCSYLIIFIKNPSDELLKYAIEKDYRSLRYLDTNQINEELVEIVLKYHGNNVCDIFRFLDDKFKTKKIIKNALNINPLVIAYLDEKELTNKICKKAIKQNPNCIRFIGEKNLTYQLCKIAIKKNPDLIFFLPNNMKTEKLCIVAIKEDPSIIEYLKSLSDKIYMIAIKKDPSIIECLIKLNINRCDDYYTLGFYLKNKMLKLAVKLDGLTLEYMPFYYQTKKICKIALKNNYQAIKYSKIKIDFDNFFKRKLII